MKINTESINIRIDQLLSDNDKMANRSESGKYNSIMVEKTIFGTVSILTTFYGKDSPQIISLLELRNNYVRAGSGWRYSNSIEIQSLINGLLNTLKSDIEFNLLNTLQNQVAGEIYGDLISLSRKLIDDGHKESAVVLACGALEDSMKKFATKNSIDAYDSDLNEVVNALRAKGLLKGTQAGVVQSYVKLRNKAFHAQFDKI